MTGLTAGPDWSGPSSDPVDQQFGDIVVGGSLNTAAEFDAILIGEPYDGAVISRPGAAEGPEAIRNALAGVKTHHFETGEIKNVADIGDIDIPTASVAKVQDTVRQATESIHALDALPIFLGGDNSLTFPNVVPLLKDSTLGVLNIDAHLDVRELRDEPTSGTPYRQLYDAGLGDYVCIGARHFETSTAYHDYVCEKDGTVVTAKEVTANLDKAIDKARSSLKNVDQIYCSVDIDVLDACYCGSSAPTPGGLMPRELFTLVRRVASDERIVGFELVECAPTLDTNGRTVDAAARTVAHFLSGWSA